MTFVSVGFVVFVGLVVPTYYALPHRLRWAFLVVASYGFYMSWHAEYALLLGVTTLVSYVTGRLMGAEDTRAGRRPWLMVSLIVDLGLLAFFKYADIVRDALANVAGGGPGEGPGELLLPVGISFYTFQALSYTIDVYRGVREPERNLGIYAAYVSFFPQLVAGPIERSRHLLPQFHRTARWDPGRAGSGALRVLWGFFKKLVVADRLAMYVDAVYDAPGAFGGLAVVAATYLFLCQLYCDFSGLCDIAIGTARMLGFDLVENFRQPFRARSIAELWQRWHISLSTWFRDYLYVPLARRRRWRAHPALDFFPVFVLIGLWHGASWNFLVFGLIHATYMATSVVTARQRARVRRSLGLHDRPRVAAALQMFVTIQLMAFSVVFFRAATIDDAFRMLGRIVTSVGSVDLASAGMTSFQAQLALCGLAVALAGHAPDSLSLRVRAAWQRRPALAWPAAYALAAAVAMFGIFGRNDFIYIQF